MVAPLRSKSAKEVSSAVLNTWVKGAGGIPKTFHADNGKEFTAHIAQQLYNKLGIHFSFGWAENHQSNPVERFHQTLYKLINSLRAEGENNFVEGVKTAVMLYNGAKHLSTGVTPNILFLGQEVVLPTDLLQGAPPLGPDNGTPNDCGSDAETSKTVSKSSRGEPTQSNPEKYRTLFEYSPDLRTRGFSFCI
jgi:hypothetical protein